MQSTLYRTLLARLIALNLDPAEVQNVRHRPQPSPSQKDGTRCHSGAMPGRCKGHLTTSAWS